MRNIVKICSLKYDGMLNYEWSTTLLECTCKYLLVKGEANRKLIHHGKGKVFSFENPSIEYFPFNEWFTFSVERAESGKFNYYCNICMPAKFENNVLSFIDLDFDIIKQPNGEWTVVDQEEFIINR